VIRAAPSVLAGLAMMLAACSGSGAGLRTCAMKRELARTTGGTRLTAGPAHAPEAPDADAITMAERASCG
jgi:protoporphyrinogen/coproporphyrinogen III oxidase